METSLKTDFDEALKRVASAGNEALVLTANLRQGRYLKRLLVERNKAVFELPQILTVDHWVKQLWSDMGNGEVRSITDKVLEQWAWNKVLEDANDLPPLIDQNKLAKHLLDAETIAEWYQIPESEILDARQDECSFYLKYRKLKQNLLKRHGLIAQHDAAHLLLSELKPSSNPVYLYGFVELPPLTHDLVSTFSEHLENIDALPYRTTSQYWKHSAQQVEWKQAALYAKSKLEEQPDRKLAIVIPTLSQQLSEISAVFAKHLEPEHYYMGLNESPVDHVDISAGHPLIRTSIVACALSLLSLLDRRIDKSTLKNLFHSSYWHSSEVADKQTLFADVIEIEQEDYSVSHVIHKADKNKTIDIEGSLAARLAKLRQHRRVTQDTKSIADWTNWLVDYLKQASWPGSHTLNSRDYQYLQNFRGTLKKLISDGRYLSSRMRYNEFKSMLILRLQNEVAHIEIKQPKIFILGLMEAAHLSFDEVMILGLNENTLPVQPKINPFLPSLSQIERQTPRSGHEREQKYSEALLDSIVYSNPCAILSYAETSDNSEQHPSSLIQRYIKSKPDESPQAHTASTKDIEAELYRDIGFENFDSFVAGPAPAIPSGAFIPGSSNHLNLFQINPLYAFFEYRLGIKHYKHTRHGLDPSRRGAVLHNILKTIYERFPTQGTLKTFRESDDYYTTLESIIDETMRNLSEKSSISHSVIRYEKQRLSEKITGFLDIDLEREQAFSVRELESETVLAVSDFKLKLIVDRIDSIENHSDLIIDYKSGPISLKGLISEQTQEFQLPLYALAFPSAEIGGVSYVEISKSATRFLGLADAHISIDGIKVPNKIRNSELPDEFKECVQLWQNNVTQCVNAIASGFCDFQVNNKDKIRFYGHFDRVIRSEEKYGVIA